MATRRPRTPSRTELDRLRRVRDMQRHKQRYRRLLNRVLRRHTRPASRRS